MEHSKLFSHQERLIEKNPERCLISHGTGCGKTRTTIELAYKNCDSFLVICPKALKENWRREIGNWGGGRVTPWRVMSKEEFKRDYERLEKFEGVIVDEGHYFFSAPTNSSQLTKSLLGYFKKYDIKYRWIATATPYLSTAWNIYTAAKLLGHDWSYPKFKDKFFQMVPFGKRWLPIQREGIEGEIAQLVKMIGDTVSMDEVVDIPEQVFETEYIKLTSKQEAKIKNIPDILPIVRFTKQHQIENGISLGDDYNPSEAYDCQKNDRILELIEEFKKVSIICRYNYQIDIIKDLIVDKNVFVIRGDVKDRDSVVQKINESKECVVLINSACSEGYGLPTIDAVIFASLGFSFKDYKQMIGRYLRIDKLKKNLFIHLISGDVDQAVFDSIMSKQDFDIEIYSKNIK
jgi:superfamily II DNA or RNA helicase